MGGNTPSGITYIITIVGTLDGQSTSTTQEITIKNPCVLPAYFSVSAVTPPNFDYTLYHAYPSNVWTHFEFTITASAQVQALCGDLVYSIDGGVIDSTLSYQPSLNQIQIYSEDRGLLGGSPYPYIVSCELANFPGYGVDQAQGFISLLDICDEPLSLSSGDVVTKSYDYDGQVTFNYPGFAVNPAVCDSEKVASCTFISGPYTGAGNLCDIAITNGAYSTSTGYNTADGTFQF